jgi:hypothetical protein
MQNRLIHQVRSSIIGFASLAMASMAILVVAAPAGAREFDLVGLSTVKGCNSDVPVKFTVRFKHGKLKVVDDFRAKGFNYPNLTPPIPDGKPTGTCWPGEEGWYHYQFRDKSAPNGFTSEIRFGAGEADEPNEFVGIYKVVYSGHTLWEDYVQGIVNVKKRDNGTFNVKAHGGFVSARSEGGLDFGGGSTGLVTWQASDD